MNYYQFTYDPTQGFNTKTIHDFITTSVEFSDWWHYLPNVYVLESKITASEITDKIIRAFPELRIFVVKVDLNAYNGYLKKSAWEWIRKKNKQKVVYKPVPSTDFVKSAVQKAIEEYNTKPPTPNVDALLEALLKKRSDGY